MIVRQDDEAAASKLDAKDCDVASENSTEDRCVPSKQLSMLSVNNHTSHFLMKMYTDWHDITFSFSCL